jgi:transcriptional regulator with XRE-family HTH domain
MDGKAIKAILGKNIKSIRSQKGLTQAVLAEKANISVIFLSSIERGTKYPKADILARIAQVLEVEAFELFKGELVPYDSKKLVTNLSNDITKKVNSALNDIFKQYLSCILEKSFLQ